MVPKRFKIASYCYFFVAGIGIVLGLVYLFYPTILPYHLKLINSSWQDLPPIQRLLLLSAMRIVGAFSFSTGAFIVLVTKGPFLRGESWAKVALPLLGLIPWATLSYITFKLAYQTSSWTPWPGCLVVVLVILVGSLLGSGRKANE